MTNKEWERYSRYFKAKEFDSPDKSGSGRGMKKIFMEKLYQARSLSSVAYKITSGYRTPKFNKDVGGVKGSSHMKYEACDIAVSNSHQRFMILQCLLLAGFERIGIGAKFIHCDISSKPKSQRAAWLY